MVFAPPPSHGGGWHDQRPFRARPALSSTTIHGTSPLDRSGPDPTPRKRKTLGRVARWAFALAVIAGLLIASRGRWSDISDSLTVLLVLVLIPVIVLNLISNLVLADNWGRLLDVVGWHLPATTVRRIWIRGQLARYAFGSAQLVSRPALARTAGVPLRAGAFSTVVETVWQTSLTATAAALLAPAWLDVAPTAWVVMASALVGTTVIVVLSVAPESVLGPVVRWVGHERAVTLTVGRRQAQAISAWFGVNTVLRTFSFLLLYAAIGQRPLTLAVLVLVAAAFVTGNLAGRLVIFAPGGLGPREAVSGILLSAVVSPGQTVVLLAASRLAETIAEAVLLGAGARRGEHAPETVNSD